MMINTYNGGNIDLSRKRISARLPTLKERYKPFIINQDGVSHVIWITCRRGRIQAKKAGMCRRAHRPFDFSRPEAGAYPCVRMTKIGLEWLGQT
jgi:hypothetical protein